MAGLTEEKLTQALIRGGTYEGIAAKAAAKRPDFKKLLDDGMSPKDALYDYYALGTEREGKPVESEEKREVRRELKAEGTEAGEFSVLPEAPAPAPAMTPERAQANLERAQNLGGLSGLSAALFGPSQKDRGVILNAITPEAPAPFQVLDAALQAQKQIELEPRAAIRDFKDDVDTIRKVAGAAAEEQGIPRTVLGMATQIGLDESSKVAATKAGSKKGVKGAAAGYVSGALLGGAASSYAAQKIEGGDDISWGRIISDSFLNVIPGAKLKKGPKALKVVSEKMAKRPIASTAAVGAVAGTGSSMVEQLVDEGEVDFMEAFERGGWSTVLGAGLGVSQKAASKLYQKIGNKTPEQLDKMVAKGDPDAVSYFDAITAEIPNEKLASADAPAQQLNRLVEFSKERPNQKLRQKMASIIPSLTVGGDVTYEMQKAQQRVAAKQDRGRTLGARVKYLINKSDNPEEATKAANDYLLGNVDKLPKEMDALGKELSDARAEIRLFQQEMLDNHHSGKRLLPEAQAEQIEASLNRGDYLTRSYRAFDDKAYTPSDADYKAAIDYLTSTPRREVAQKTITKKVKDGVRMKVDVKAEPKELPPMTVAEADAYLGDLKAKFRSAEDGYAFMQSKDANILKQKNDVAAPIRKWLGEYEEPGKKISDTISRMAKKAGYDTGDIATQDALVRSGLAQVVGGADGKTAAPSNWVPLKLRHGNAVADGQPLMVSPDVQKAINSIYGMDMDGKTQSNFAKAWNAAVSMSKATKVVANPASYAPNVWSGAAYMTAMGMNPTRGLGRALMASLGQFDAVAKRAPRKMMKVVDDYREKGVLPQALLFEDMQAGLKGGKVRASLAKYLGFDVAGKVFSMADQVARIVVYENTSHLYRKAAGAITADQAKILDDLAARDTNKVFPNYDRLNKHLRKASQLGALNQFVSFSAELTRNAVNQAKTALDMINGKLANELEQKAGVAVNRRTLQLDGIKRIVGLGSVIAGAEAGRRMYNRQTMTEDEETRIKRTVLADYLEGNPVGMKVDWDTGEIVYNNTSYMNPYAVLGNAIWGFAEADDAEGAVKHVWDQAKANLLGEGSFVFRTLGQMVGNQNWRTRRNISNEVDDWRKMTDILQFGGVDAFEPGFVREKRRFDEKGATQLMQRLAGARVENTDILKGVSFKLSESKKSMNNVLRDISGLRYALEDGKKSQEQVDAEYQANNETYRRIQEKLIMHIDDLKKLRRSDDEIFATLQASGLGAKRSLYAYDGVVLDAPKNRAMSMAEKYDEAMAEANGNFEQAAKAFSQDPFELRRFANEHTKRIKYQALDIKTKDDMVRALDSSNGDRAEYIYAKMKQSDNPDAVLRQFIKKNLVNAEVLTQIKARQGADK